MTIAESKNSKKNPNPQVREKKYTKIVIKTELGLSEPRNIVESIEENTVDFSIQKMQRYCDNCAVPQVDRCTQVWVTRTELMPNSCKNGAKVSTMDETITRRLNRNRT